MNDKLNEVWDKLLELELFTEEELQLITCINGWNEETFNDAIYARYGYHSLEQLMECEECE